MKVGVFASLVSLVAVGSVSVVTILSHPDLIWLEDQEHPSAAPVMMDQLPARPTAGESLPLHRRIISHNYKEESPPGLLDKWFMWQYYTFLPNNEQQQMCKLYMAPSTNPGAVALGLFTAVPLERDAVIGQPNVVIPIMSMKDNRQVGYFRENYAGENEDSNNTSTIYFCSGSGINTNYLGLNNMLEGVSLDYDMMGTVRSRDAGAGAFTPFQGSKSVIIHPVQAGSELFSPAADDWFSDRFAEPEPDPVYAKADKLMGYFSLFCREHEMEEELKEAMWKDLIQNFPFANSKVIANLPQQGWGELIERLSTDPSLFHPGKGLSVELTRQKHVRSVDWLQENGYCMDNLRPGKSTVHAQAGRGSFATRFFKKGHVVAFAPLMHDVLDQDDPVIEFVRNYSFRHGESTIRLTPYSAGVSLINHASDRRASSSYAGPNVKIQWPKHSFWGHEGHYLTKSLSELPKDEIVVSFEYVALRNIYPGEEVLLDYGVEWEEAWRKHVRTWRPPRSGSNANYQYHPRAPIRTIDEQEDVPYPDNVVVRCELSYSLQTEDEASSDGAGVAVSGECEEKENSQTNSIEDTLVENGFRDETLHKLTEILKRIDDEYNTSTAGLFQTGVDLNPQNQSLDVAEQENQTHTNQHTGVARYVKPDGTEPWHPECKILKREVVNNEYMYTAEMETGDTKDAVPQHVTVSGIPWHAVSLDSSAPAVSDWSFPEAFRHEAMIPDDIFPKAWRNKKRN